MTIAERMKRSKGVDTGQNEEIRTSERAILVHARRLPRDVVVIGVVALVATGSFGLGIVAGRESGGVSSDKKLLIEKTGTAEIAPAAVGAALEPPTDTKEDVAAKPVPPVSATGGQYVASKTGTKYYLPWCGTAKRIKDENKVWFASKGEAEAAGYEPAKNCKGL